MAPPERERVAVALGRLSDESRMGEVERLALRGPLRELNARDLLAKVEVEETYRVSSVVLLDDGRSGAED